MLLIKSKTFSGYKLHGRMKLQGLPISIENERGSIRRGEDADGHEWSTFMYMKYGYIRLTEGTDGDHVDCYIGPAEYSEKVFIIHQNDPDTGKYDEDKVMLGYNNARSAHKAYTKQYDRPGFFGDMEEVDMVEFKKMLKERYGLKLKKLSKSKSKPVGSISPSGKSKKTVKGWVPVKKNIIEFVSGKVKLERKAITGTGQIISLNKDDPFRVEIHEDGYFYAYDNFDISGNKIIKREWKPIVDTKHPNYLKTKDIDKAYAYLIEVNTVLAWNDLSDKEQEDIKRGKLSVLKSLQKARSFNLHPVRKMITRGGKTFMTTVWEGRSKTDEAERLKQRSLVVTPEPPVKRSMPASSVPIVKDTREIIDFAPNDKLAIDKVLAYQKETFKGTERPSMYDMVQVAMQEFEEGSKSANSGMNWYHDSMSETRAILSQRFPSLASDQKWDFFLMILATTSPGATPKVNLRATVIIFDHYNRTGEILIKQPGTDKAFTIASTAALVKFNKAMKELGGEAGLVEYINKISTIGELKAGLGSTNLTGSKNESAYNSMIFGDKVGQFYQSLRGTYGAIAVDRWAIRTFQRWAGELEAVGAFKATGNVNRVMSETISADDRRAIEYIFQTVAEKMNLAPSQVQAVLWYYEKRLYKKLGMAEHHVKEESYSDLAKDLFVQKSMELLLTDGVMSEIQKLFALKQMPSFEQFVRCLMEIKPKGNKMDKSVGGIPNGTLIKSDVVGWACVVNGQWVPFVFVTDILEKATDVKKYYSAEEVKARGMRWVTIRGARVLLQGTADGGWVVVGGAGGSLTHMKIDQLMSKEEYAKKRKELTEKTKEELRALTSEELSAERAKYKAGIEKKRALRSEYEAQVKDIMGIGDIKSQVTSKEMDEINNQARQILETKKGTPLTEDDSKALEKIADGIVKQEVKKKVKDVERRALDVLMKDYMGDDIGPNDRQKMKQLMDNDKAMKVMKARRAFRDAVKNVGLVKNPIRPKLKIGDTFAARANSLEKDIIEEVKKQVETQKNIALYDLMNAQSGSVTKYVDRGAASTINGVLADVIGGGSIFSPDAVKEIGVEGLARSVAIHIQSIGKAGEVKKALEAFSDAKREEIVTKALKEADMRLANADAYRDLARTESDDAEAIMSMAQANGYALKEIVAAQQEIGTATGSLQAMAHILNALNDPPADSVMVAMGTDLNRARDRAKKAGLKRGEYSIRKTKKGGKRLILEIPKKSLSDMIAHNKEMRKQEAKIDKIKKHLSNDGYMPEGMAKTIHGNPLKLTDAQEAGLKFFMEQDKVLLDFAPGTGKSAIALAAAMEAMKNKGAKKILIVTPAKLRDDYEHEHAPDFLDDEHKGLVKSTGSMGPKARRALYLREKGIDVIGHDTLSSDHAAIKAAGYDMIVIDEIHEMTPQGKGKGSQRFRGMMELTDIPLKIGMSGTNIKNNKTELHRKIEFLDPEHTLGSLAGFEKKYKGLNQGTSAFEESSNDAFRKEVAPWTYTQVNHLPSQHRETKLRVSLTQTQRGKIKNIMEVYRDEKERKVPGAAARRDSNMYQVVHDDAFATNSKAGKIVELMKGTHANEKAVIHVTGIKAMETTIDRLEQEFGKGCVKAIAGQAPYDSEKHIRDAKKDFNDPNSPVRFIIGTKSLEAGHNLQGGTVNFHLDQPMTYAAMDQRNKRTYRRGQTKDVHTYTLSGTNPIDLRREALLSTKKREMELLGNPQEIEGFDGKGFLSYLKQAEEDLKSGK